MYVSVYVCVGVHKIHFANLLFKIKITKYRYGCVIRLTVICFASKTLAKGIHRCLPRKHTVWRVGKVGSPCRGQYLIISNICRLYFCY